MIFLASIWAPPGFVRLGDDSSLQGASRRLAHIRHHLHTRYAMRSQRALALQTKGRYHRVCIHHCIESIIAMRALAFAGKTIVGLPIAATSLICVELKKRNTLCEACSGEKKMLIQLSSAKQLLSSHYSLGYNETGTQSTRKIILHRIHFLSRFF